MPVIHEICYVAEVGSWKVHKKNKTLFASDLRHNFILLPREKCGTDVFLRGCVHICIDLAYVYPASNQDCRSVLEAPPCSVYLFLKISSPPNFGCQKERQCTVASFPAIVTTAPFSGFLQGISSVFKCFNCSNMLMPV